MLKRPQTEPFHDTAARILPAERDDTPPARLTVFDEPLKLTKNFSKLGLGCSAKCEIVGITLSRSWDRKHSLRFPVEKGYEFLSGRRNCDSPLKMMAFAHTFCP
jgi:hypothetical protein